MFHSFETRFETSLATMLVRSDYFHDLSAG